MLLARALDKVIRTGRLGLEDAHGGRHRFTGAPGPSASVKLHDASLHWKLLLQPRLAVPEAFMDGTLTIEEGTLYDFLDLLALNSFDSPNPLWRFSEWAALWSRRLHQYN